VTLMMVSTASGHLLKSQVIIPGKTTWSLPPTDKLQPLAKYSTIDLDSDSDLVSDNFD